MITKTLRIGILSTASAVAIFAFPSVSNAEYFVPPGNSAVNQYTESVPTAGGHRDVNKGRNGGSTPAKVLGKENAKRLESQGDAGRKAAEVAAATAPSPAATDSPEEEQEPSESGGSGGGSQGGGGGGGASERQAAPDHQPATRVIPMGRGESVDAGGSSGLGEVLGQATGSSSGQMGLLLPLILIAALIWAALMFRRQRDRTAP